MRQIDADKIEVLRLARARLEMDEREIFICPALNQVRLHHPGLNNAAVQLMRHVAKEIAPRSTLGAWLVEEVAHHDSLLDLLEEDIEVPHEPTLKMCRLAWIDKMIYDLENSHAS